MRKALPILLLLLVLRPTWAATPQPLTVVRFQTEDSTVPRNQALSYVRGHLDVQNRGSVAIHNVSVRLHLVTLSGASVWSRTDPVGSLKPGQHYRTDFLVYNSQFNTVRAFADCSYTMAGHSMRLLTQASVPAAGPAVDGNVPTYGRIATPPDIAPPGYERSSPSSTLRTYEEKSKNTNPPGY